MSQQSSETEPVVFVVDDDAAMRKALCNLLASVGLRVQAFASAPDFLAIEPPAAPSCLILDVRLPGPSGLEFQAKLASANIDIPIIFVTGHGDIPMSVRAMKAGAIEFLTKPFRDQDLLDAVQVALGRDRARHQSADAVARLREKFATLTPREQEVMACVTGGLINKQVAAQIGITEQTVKVHRGNLVRKMGARSLAELVRMADLLGVHRSDS
ncbi:MAG TPA: response regulator transcription factor [Xanthobacteraceae bacterium]|nr:response regulator transcription factor [Xanthobacteraceae bacterium]